MDFNIFSLSSTIFFSIISLFCIIFIFIFHHHPSHSQPSNKTPSPESYPVIGNLIGFIRNRHHFHDWVADMLSDSPSLTIQVNGLLNSCGICTVDPHNIQHLLATNFSNYIKGSRYHDVLHDFLGDGIFNVDGELWTAQRKISSHEFNTKSLKNFVSETVRFQLSDRFIPFLCAASENQQVIDLQDTLKKFTFDNVCNVAFGVDPGSFNELKNNSSMNSINSCFVTAFDDAVEISSSRFMSPISVIWKIKRLLNLGSEKRFGVAVKLINDYAIKIIRIKEHEEETTKSKDLLSRFMSSSSNLEFRDQEQRRKFLGDIVISFILAGKDSTSTALTWFFWLIAGNPRCMHLIQAELSSETRTTTTTTPPVIFSYDELKKFNYLHAALSESMRLFPPVPINSRLTVMNDVLPDGTHVGKGWFADYSAYAMGRMEKLWGPDCREFKPERWLDDKGVFQPLDPFRFPVFHSGPRICLGKEMAYVQMKSIAACVMYEFEVVAVDGGGSVERMMDPPYTLSLLLKMRGGFPVKLKRRGK